MKVFLSWSGQTSREVATVLHDWLPYVIQGARPFISTGDIDKGKRWGDALADELKSVGYGIICLTQENFREPWINFEAGAISKAIDKSCVSPFLFNVDAPRIDGPLQQFQFTINEKEDIFTLLRSINGQMDPDRQLPFEVLRREFDTWWPELEGKLLEVARHQTLESGTGFDWLYTTEDLANIVERAASKSVWVITPNLYRNVLTATTKDAIQTNIKQGVHYTFIIPAATEMDIAKEGLKQIAISKPDQVQIDELPPEDFRTLAVTDYILLDPDTNGSQVFLELPISARGYWIKVDDEAAIGLVVRFRRVANRTQKN
jgi:hypothetical protein